METGSGKLPKAFAKQIGAPCRMMFDFREVLDFGHLLCKLALVFII
jgi:hypothetical protein